MSRNCLSCCTWLTLLLTAFISGADWAVAAQEGAPGIGGLDSPPQHPPLLNKKITGTSLVEWSTTNIQYLYGFNWNVGRDVRDTFTLEHADAWRYGDNYFFLDVYDLVERDRLTDTTYYGEWHPRFSLSKIFGRGLSAGPIKDVLISHELTFAEGFLTYSSGIGLSLGLPQFSFANVSFLAKDNIDQGGVTWQIIVDWLIPFTLYGLPLSYGGYIDFAGPEGHLVETIFSDTQLLLDVGHFFRYEEHLFVGVEFRYIHNQFFLDGEDEFVPQPLLKWTF